MQALDRTQPMLPLRPGQIARRTHDYTRHGTASLYAAFDVATGKLLAPRDPHPIAGAQQYFFIDKGRRDGVALGDVFEVYSPAQGYAGSASEEVRAVLMIVHTRERSATGLLLQISHPSLDRGLPVRLIKKMPS